MDHVRELQGRLFAVAIGFIVFSAAAYPFFDKIANFLLAPLGKNHELVYLTPGGAFSFIIQVCMYIGFVCVLPVIIFNLYRFIMPVMNHTTLMKAVIFTGISFLLALVGTVFAYYVSLPTALYFLTSFDLYHINPMLTVDSYFSFIMTYMIIGALLFQIPLLMLLIDGVKPQQPKNLMRYQGKIILVSFIVAAVVSPTPDALNQALLASPMVVMYQIGIVIIWIGHHRTRTRKLVQSYKYNTNEQSAKYMVQDGAIPSTQTHVTYKPLVNYDVMNTTVTASSNVTPKAAKRSIDGMLNGEVNRRPIIKSPMRRQITTIPTSVSGRESFYRSRNSRQSIDGFVVASQFQP